MGLADVTIYRLQYTNFEQKLCVIDIQDQTTLSEFPTGTVIRDLPGGNIVARLSTLDASDDKLTPIKGQKLEITFIKDIYGLSTFTVGDDKRWKVTAYYNSGGAIFFQGFLVMDDNREPYQDVTQVTLTATDGLGLLSLVPISDFTGARLSGKYKLIDLIAFCLAKTGLQLKIKVVNSLFETTQPDRTAAISNGPFHQLYIDANTFEKDIAAIGLINQVEDCYTVIRKILYPHSRLFYYNGDWWIIRLDEIKNLARSYTQYNYDGAVIDGTTDTVWPQKEIGNDTYLTHFINQDAGVMLKSPYKLASLQYRLEPPTEIICNNKFLRGAVASPLVHGGSTASHTLNFADGFNFSFLGTDAAYPPGFYGYVDIIGPILNKGRFYVNRTRVVSGSTEFTTEEATVNETHNGTINSFGYSAIFPECWTLKKGYPTDLGVPDANGFVKIVFDTQGYELERYLQVSQAGSNAIYFYKSNVTIPVGALDKIVFSVDYRYSTDLGGTTLGSGLKVAQIRLYGDNGTHWILDPDYVTGYPKWALSNVSWSINNKYIEFSGDATQTNFRQWQSVSVKSAPMPTDGEIEIYLMDDYQPDQQDKHFTNLSLEYLPYINGNYQKYSAEFYKVSTDLNRQKREEEIFVSGSPRKLFKGALHTFDGTAFHLALKFNDWALINNGGTGLGAERFGKWQVYAMWNQYRLAQRVFEMSLQGLQSDQGSLHNGLGQRYLIQNISEHNLNKYFIPLSMDQDWYRCTDRTVMAEADYNPNSRSFADTFLFKYLF